MTEILRVIIVREMAGGGGVFDDEISRRRNLQSYMFERFYEESDLVKNRS